VTAKTKDFPRDFSKSGLKDNEKQRKKESHHGELARKEKRGLLAGKERNNTVKKGRRRE